MGDKRYIGEAKITVTATMFDGMEYAATLRVSPHISTGEAVKEVTDELKAYLQREGYSTNKKDWVRSRQWWSTAEGMPIESWERET